MSSTGPDGCDPMRALLEADLDGELDAASSARLAEHVAGCAACATLQADLLALRAELTSALPYHRAPEGLRRSLAPKQSVRPRWPVPAAFAAGAIAAGLALAVLPRAGSPDGGFDPLLEAHLRALQPGHLMDVASNDQHNVKPWFDGRLDYAPPVKDLSAAGFPLAGGRLDRLGGRTVAALVYQRQKHVIDVFVWPDGAGMDAAAHRAQDRQGYNIVRWSQDGFAFVAVSDLNRTELAQFAASWQAMR